LIEKLLPVSLRYTKEEIFIVLDGLDEADMEAVDTTERISRPEIEVLLDRLATLSNARLLFISRPQVNITGIISSIVDKPISSAENKTDIDKYVKEFIANSGRHDMIPSNTLMKRRTEYFLWVVLVLKQSEKPRSTSEFPRQLVSFTQAPGSKESLYSNILSKFNLGG